MLSIESKSCVTGRRAERRLEPVTGRRVTYARAGIDVVVAEGRAHHLLHQVGFLVGAARRSDPADGVAAIAILHALQFSSGVSDGFLPRNFLPGVDDALADHRLLRAIRMGRVAPGEAPFDARMAVIGEAVLIRHHADDFVALDLGLEGTADAAITAGGDNRAIGAALLEHRLFHQRVGRAGLHAGAAGDAFGVDIMLMLSGGHQRVEAASLDRQGKSSLRIVTGAHATRAQDASRGIEGEVWIGVVDLEVEMILAAVVIADVLQPGNARHFVQFAPAARLAFEGIERMVRHVEFHHAAAKFRKLFVLGMHLHSGFHRGGAGCRVTVASFDLDQAEAAGAKRAHRIGRAKFGYRDSGKCGGAQDRGALGHGDATAVNFERDQLFERAGGVPKSLSSDR